MAMQTRGRRALEGNAPPKIEQLGGRPNQQDSQSEGTIQEIDAAIRSGAVRALRKRVARQDSLAAVGTAAASERFDHIVIRTGEAAIALRLAAALTQITDELEAGGGV